MGGSDGGGHDPQHSQYQQSLDYLFARTTGAYRFGLERTTALLDELGNPHRAVPCIHIAGTNGKGSSVATATALLESRGLRVATYTSPHLVDFRERIVVGGEPIPAEAVVDFIGRHMPAIERIGASFFEATTAMAFDHFARSGADVSVVEVGLGGRLDSTNVVDPAAAGVCSIGRDHMEYLGDTLEAIAMEKAGIFKANRPAVIGETDPMIRTLLGSEAGRRDANPVRLVADEVVIDNIEVGREGTSFFVKARGEQTRLVTPLAGRQQATNTVFAWMLLDAAGPRFSVPLSEACAALSRVHLAGRFQRVGRYIFDVAHNADGARVLAETLHATEAARPLVALFSVLGDKDWRGMLTALTPEIDCFVVTNTPTAPASRVWNLDEVKRFADERQIEVHVEPDFERALQHADDLGRTTLVTGSFHTVGDAMVCLQLSPLAR